MKYEISSWDLYRTFLEVVRTGSLSAAARRLGLTQPTAGRHIDALEHSLGVVLFTRSQRGLSATPAAHELRPHAEAMASAEAALKRAASGEADHLRGAVRVTASELMACEVLPPILASFCAGYPTVEIELSVSNQVQNLLRRDADIALRTARPKQGSLVAKHVGSVRLGLFAHRSYAEARGIPRTIAELRQHRLIGFDHDDTSFRAVGVSRLPISRETFGFRSDSDLAQLAALRAGVGIAGCQIRISARDDQLVPVLPMEVRFRVELWLVTHKDLRATRRVRLLFDHLAKGLKAYASAP